jgi:hypothetical protein
LAATRCARKPAAEFVTHRGTPPRTSGRWSAAGRSCDRGADAASAPRRSGFCVACDSRRGPGDLAFALARVASMSCQGSSVDESIHCAAPQGPRCGRPVRQSVRPPTPTERCGQRRDQRVLLGVAQLVGGSKQGHPRGTFDPALDRVERVLTMLAARRDHGLILGGKDAITQGEQ